MIGRHRLRVGRRRSVHAKEWLGRPRPSEGTRHAGGDPARHQRQIDAAFMRFALPRGDAGSVAVNLDDAGVDHGAFHLRLIRDGVEKPFENTGFDPIPVALETVFPVAEKARQVAQAQAFALLTHQRVSRQSP
jgi:hypothetical protein